MPLYTAEALVLRTYKLGEADRIVVFLTRDRGKKRGVAPNARKSRKRFGAALEPLTEVKIAYFEREQRDLVMVKQDDAAIAALVHKIRMRMNPHPAGQMTHNVPRPVVDPEPSVATRDI